MSKAEICKVPDTLKFQFQEDQEMHSSIVMENLMDKVVKYKVTTYWSRSKPTNRDSTSSNLWRDKSSAKATSPLPSKESNWPSKTSTSSKTIQVSPDKNSSLNSAARSPIA